MVKQYKHKGCKVPLAVTTSEVPFNSLYIHVRKQRVYSKLIISRQIQVVGLNRNILYGFIFNAVTKNVFVFFVSISVVDIFRGNNQKIEFVSG